MRFRLVKRIFVFRVASSGRYQTPTAFYGRIRTANGLLKRVKPGAQHGRRVGHDTAFYKLTLPKAGVCVINDQQILNERV